MDQHEIARRVLLYLIAHPDAKDTPEGISMWWLRQQGARASAAHVAKELEWLAAKGWLAVVRRPPLAPLYGMDATKLDDIQHFTTSRSGDV